MLHPASPTSSAECRLYELWAEIRDLVERGTRAADGSYARDQEYPIAVGRRA